MIVKDLLFQCSIDDVVDSMVKKEYEDVNRGKVYNALNKLIEELKKRTPIPGNYIVLGVEQMSFGEKVSDASLYNIDEINNEFRTYSELEDLSDIDELSDSEIEMMIKGIKLPQSYAYEYEKWDKILGYNIDENNAESYGKNKLLTDVLYEMTFFGLDESNVDKEREILRQRTEEVDKILELPEEEQRKYFVPMEEVNRRFGREERSPEEETEQIKKFNREMCYTTCCSPTEYYGNIRVNNNLGTDNIKLDEK